MAPTGCSASKLPLTRALMRWAPPRSPTFSKNLNGERDAPSELTAAGFAFLLALVSGEEVMKESDEPVRFLAGGEAKWLAPPPDISAPLITFEIYKSTGFEF